MLSSKGKPFTILMADDDEDDRLLTQDALQESRVRNNLYCVEDGVELLEYLRREGKYTSGQEEDKVKGYNLGAASYITKPVNFEGLVELMKALGKYWIEFVELPNE
jgi:CheY-like chemotaxis protein